MQPRTRFLARLFGLFLAIVGVEMLTAEPGMVAVANSLVHDRAATLVVSLVCLAAGLATVLGHNIWSGGAATVLVTVLGWLLVLRGILLLFLPPRALQAMVAVVGGPVWIYIAGTIVLGLGAYLTYAGFTAPQPRKS